MPAYEAVGKWHPIHPDANEDIFLPPIASNSIEVCVFSFVHDQPLYLLLRRAKEETLYPDLWQMISGSIEEGESASDAALRELREETGFTPTRFWVAPHVSMFYDAIGNVTNLSPLFAAQVAAGSAPKLSSEHQAYGWYSFDDAWRKLVWPGQKEGIRIVHEYIVKGTEAGRRTLLF